MKQFTIMVIFFSLLTGCANSQSRPQKGTIEHVDAKRFKELVDAGNGIVLDVRTPKELSEGYIAHAVNINIYEDDFEDRINKLAKDKEVYVYCKAGGRSSDASDILQKNGFLKVYNLENGLSEWQKNGFPVEKQ